MGSKSYHNSFISLGLFPCAQLQTVIAITMEMHCINACICIFQWTVDCVDGRLSVSGWWSDQMRPHKFEHCTPNTIYCFHFIETHIFFLCILTAWILFFCCCAFYIMWAFVHIIYLNNTFGFKQFLSQVFFLPRLLCVTVSTLG